MNSCFPQLTALNIKDDKIDEKNNRKKNFYCSQISNSKCQTLSKSKGRMSSVGNNLSTCASLANANGDLKSAVGKIEVLQDLDLYYIKQIAHSLKVRNTIYE